MGPSAAGTSCCIRIFQSLRCERPLSYKCPMADTNFFPRRLILGGASISGVLLALAVHMLVARYGLDLGGLWRSDTKNFMPAGAAIAWWLIATVAFSGGYFTANLMHSAAAAPSGLPTFAGVLAGIAALCLGAIMAFCGAHFALRKA